MSEETIADISNKSASKRQAAVKGASFMAGAGLLIAITHVLVRDLSSDVHPIQIAFFRNVIGFLMLVPFLLRQDRVHWKSKQPKLQFIRAMIGTCAMLSWFTCLSMLPVADATAISFVTVLFITIGASVFLGEKVGVRRWVAIAVGFVGTLIIVRPGTEFFGPGAIVALCSTVFWAASMLCVKVLSRTDSSVTMVFYANVFFTIFSFIPALFVWSTPNEHALIMMGIIGVMATLAHLCMAQALKLTHATVVAPVDYTRLLWAAGIGYVVFGEFPDVWTWVGGTVIFLSTIYITYRESQRGKASPPSVTPSTTAGT